jgi:hypothetical protein
VRCGFSKPLVGAFDVEAAPTLSMEVIGVFATPRMKKQIARAAGSRCAGTHLGVAACEHQTQIRPGVGMHLEMGFCPVGRLAGTQVPQLPTGQNSSGPLTSRKKPVWKPIGSRIPFGDPRCLCPWLRHWLPAFLDFKF